MAEKCKYCARFLCECSGVVLIRRRRSYIQVFRVTTPPPPPVEQSTSGHGGNSGQTHFHPRGLKHNRKMRPGG